jgi:hypothetical protein
MKGRKHLFVTGLLFILVLPLFAQQLISATYLGERTMAQLSSKYGLSFFKNGVKYYKVIYRTPDIKGNPSNASGLLVIPDDLNKSYPILAYQHGTVATDKDVPSSLSGEAEIPILFGGLGYITVAADYLGFAESAGFHPYIHAETEATAAVDLMRASREYAISKGIRFSQQNFVTGYSQGGHAAMALHRKLELELSKEFQVTASAPMSGPYSIGEVMRSLVLSEKEYLFPAYIPNTICSYQLAYGNIYKEITDVFRQPYAGLIEKFVKEEVNLTQLNTQLIEMLKAQEGASKPILMLQPNLVSSVSNDSLHPFNKALKANNVYQWAPKAPTRLFYCKNDDQVPYLNSVLADSVMRALGAVNLQAIDVNPAANHGQCAYPAILNTSLFFANYQKIVDLTTPSLEAAFNGIDLFPNPAQNQITIRGFYDSGILSIRDLSGKLLKRHTLNSGTTSVEMGNLSNGIYLLEIRSSGKIWREKLTISKN